MTKKFKAIVAMLSAATLVMSGTFAFQQIVSKINEFKGEKDGTTLHDDFDPGDGTKNVYVENQGSETMIVRVRLDEYMDLTSNVKPANIPWTTHTCSTSPEDCGHANKDGMKYHDYFHWKMGGSKWYMPTTGHNNLVQDTTDYTNAPGAAQTPDAKIVSMADYLAMNAADRKVFEGWICDPTDGYAYWSQPLKQGMVTGLLLDKVVTDKKLKNTDYYYAINVILETVSRSDLPMWTQGAPSVDDSNVFHQEATADGKQALAYIMENDDDPNANKTLAVLPPADPDLGYTPHLTGGPNDEGGWFTATGDWSDQVLNEKGGIRLEDILPGPDYSGVTVEPLDPRFKGMFEIGQLSRVAAQVHAGPCILYSAMPTRDEAYQEYLAHEFDTDWPVTTTLRITQNGKSADIKVTLEYRMTLISFE